MSRHPEARDLHPGEEEPTGDGDCYQAAFCHLMDNHADDPSLRLVHAVCLIGVGDHAGLPFGHAWCERDEPLPSPPGWNGPSISLPWVVDKSNGRDISMPAALYYHGGRPTQIHRYTFEEASRWALETGHYGHWELEVAR